MDKTLRKLASFEEAKEEEYRYWQSVPPAERIAAAWQLSIEAYRRNGFEPDGQELRRIVTRSSAHGRGNLRNHPEGFLIEAK
jgi:hypothetical protein